MLQVGKTYTIGGCSFPPLPGQVNIDVYEPGGIQYYNDNAGEQLTVGSTNGVLTFAANDATVSLKSMGWSSKLKLSMNVTH